MNEQDARDVLKEVADILTSHNVHYWLDTGTLLAAVRDGAFIPWDNDIDLGTWDATQEDLVSLASTFRAHGFTIRYFRHAVSLRKKECPVNISFYRLENDKALRDSDHVYASHAIIDRVYRMLSYIIYPTYFTLLSWKDARTLPQYCDIFCARCSSITPRFIRKNIKALLSKNMRKESWIIDAKYFADTETVTFYGTHYPVPRHAREYIRFRYGDSWDVPNKDWVTARDDKAVCATASGT